MRKKPKTMPLALPTKQQFDVSELSADPVGRAKMRALVLSAAVENMHEEGTEESTHQFAESLERHINDFVNYSDADAYKALVALDFILEKWALTAMIAADEKVKRKG